MSYVAKLFVFGQEREVVNAAITYHRLINNRTGRADGEPQGGLIDLEILSSYEDDSLARWIINEPEDKLCTLTKGALVFYKESFNNPPAFTYKFNDAALIKYSEEFSAQDDTPMTLKMTISPAIQEYKEQTVVKHWQENWTPPSEKTPYQAVENKELQLTKAHFEDLDGNPISADFIGDSILVIETQNRQGEKLDIDLADKNHDFIYKGKKLKDDVLTSITITGDSTKIPLTIIQQVSL